MPDPCRPRTEEDEDNVHNEAEEEGAASVPPAAEEAGEQEDLSTLRPPGEAAVTTPGRQWRQLRDRLFPGATAASAAVAPTAADPQLCCWRGLWRLLKAPATLALAATVPVSDAEREDGGWSRYLAVVHCYLTPVFVCFAAGVQVGCLERKDFWYLKV